MLLSFGQIPVARAGDTAQVIPTTSNPTGNGSPGVRVISNPSFELPNNPSGHMTCELNMAGWFTTHSNRNDPALVLRHVQYLRCGDTRSAIM
jgi:hypothetical protein